MISDSELRAISHELLGNAYILEISVAISEFSDGVFHQQLICKRLNLGTSVVRPVLRKLENGGLIKRRPKVGQE